MHTETASSVARLSLDRVSSRLAQEKQELVLFLIELAAFDQQKHALELGYPSTLGCLQGELGMTESSACRRISAARLLARFPSISRYLLAHRLTLTGLLTLKDIIDETNVEDLLERAAGLSEPAVRELVMRVRMDAARPAPATTGPGVATEPAAGAEVVGAETVAEAVTDARPPAAVAPDDRTSLTLWVRGEFREELEAVRNLLSHAVPSGRQEDVLLYVLRRVRKQHEAKKYGQSPNASPAPPAIAGSPRAADNRHIPAWVRRAVGQREGWSCAFLSAEGRRCGSKWQLEFQHIDPAARGGEATVENITLYCRQHNQLQAERDFGKDHVAARIVESQAGKSAPAAAARSAPHQHAADCVSALVNLGFKRKQAEPAVVQAGAELAADSDIQTLLRAALRHLVPSNAVR